MDKYALQDTLLLLELEVVFTVDVSEAPLTGHDDLLTTRELVTGTAESLHHDGRVGILAPDGENDLANIDSSYGAVGLTPGAAHTSLKTGEGENQ